MKLAIDKRSNEIMNSYDLSIGIYEPATLIQSWVNIDGEVDYPKWFDLVEYTGFCNFKAEEVLGYYNMYLYINGEVELHRVADEYKIKDGIKQYEKLLTDTDYKIIKAYELSLVDKTSDYDLDQIHKERQIYRDEINILKELLKSIQLQPIPFVTLNKQTCTNM